MNDEQPQPVGGSFRDPDARVFRMNGVLYRSIHTSYAPHYDALMGSGLYEELVRDGLLVRHGEIDPSAVGRNMPPMHRCIRPEEVPTVSYPYEWCFSQLRDAALLTLAIQRRALASGMSLKDASAYNIQFFKGKPLFIDTSSFEIHEQGRPWVAYRQFCQHFLAPLALMAYKDIRFGQTLRIFLDGVPLDFASKLLPLRTRFKISTLVHIHLHARSQRRYAAKPEEVHVRRTQVSTRALLGMVDHLESSVRSVTWEPKGSAWSGYYDENSYSEAGLEHKERLVGEYLDRVRGTSLWDLGANTGRFSRLAAERGFDAVSWDIDPECVEINYRDAVKNGAEKVLPLVVDLSNPSPGIGWSNTERRSFIGRGPVDVVLALALVHHLAIGNNVPFPEIAGLFSRLCRRLVVEFVPKDDPMVRLLLAARRDIFAEYDRTNFEASFAPHFETIEAGEVGSTGRTLYLMRARNFTRKVDAQV